MFSRLVCVDFIDFTSEELLRLSSFTEEFERADNDPRSESEIIDRAADADALLISWRTPLSAEAIARLPRLRYVGMFSGAYTNPLQCNVDLAACKAAGIVVSTLGQYGDEATAEWVIAQMLSAARSTFPGWRREPTELFAKRLGIVGLGFVGSEVALRAAAFGMEIAYTGPSAKPLGEAQGWPRQSLQELLTQSDIVTVHVPTGVRALSFRDFHDLRSDALLINSSTGHALDVDGLNSWLANGTSAFVCDASVPVEQQHVANRYANAVFDPFVAGMSREMKRRGLAQLLECVEGFRAGDPIRVHPLASGT